MQQATVFLFLLGAACVAALQCPGSNCCPPKGAKESLPEGCPHVLIPDLKIDCHGDKPPKWQPCTGLGDGGAAVPTTEAPLKDDTSTTATTTKKPKVIALEST